MHLTVNVRSVVRVTVVWGSMKQEQASEAFASWAWRKLQDWVRAAAWAMAVEWAPRVVWGIVEMWQEGVPWTEGLSKGIT